MAERDPTPEEWKELEAVAKRRKEQEREASWKEREERFAAAKRQREKEREERREEKERMKAARERAMISGPPHSKEEKQKGFLDYWGQPFVDLMEKPELANDKSWVEKNIGDHLGSGAFRSVYEIRNHPDKEIGRAHV